MRRLIFIFSTVSILLFASTAFAKETLPAIQYLLQQESPTHLDRVLAEYEDPLSTHVFIAAHRGGKENDLQDAAPGNSIANISNATAKQFDIYESDIEILGDDTLVVFHDDEFDNLTNSLVQNDKLNDADLEYAKSLFLTFDDGSVSNERIPTLEEMMLSGKGKIVFKFDLKSDTFGTSTLIRIFQTFVDTGTTKQVFVRGGENLLSVANLNGFDTRMVMRRFNSAPSIEDIQNLAENSNAQAISIPSGAADNIIQAALTAGLIVETHELQGVTENERTADYTARVAQGVRQFHSFKPTQLKSFLELNQLREF